MQKQHQFCLFLSQRKKTQIWHDSPKLTVNETVSILISGSLGTDGINATGDASFCSTGSVAGDNKWNKISTVGFK